MIKDGEISPNFLVKSENDQKVYFSNSKGYKLVVSGGDTYNMYKVDSSLEASFAGTNHIAFQILDANGVPVTTRLDWYCSADNHGDPDCPWGNYIYEGSETGVTDFEVDWAQIQDFGSGDTYVGYEVEFEPDGIDPHVSVIGFYYMTDEEVCSCAGGTWDPVNQECIPAPCSDRGLCGDDPYDCHECTCEEQYEEGTQELCECQGKYWYNDTCNDEPESEPTCEDQGLCDDGEGNCVECDECGGDPECECNAESGYNWWEADTCHSCEEEWESLGYSSPEECACDKRGEDSGVCPEPDPEEE